MKLNEPITFKRKKQSSSSSKIIKYPTKATMNLAVNETTDNSLSRVLPAAALILVLVALFVKFAVVDRYLALTNAQSTLNAAEAQLNTLNTALSDYDSVSEEYQLYSDGYLTDEQKALVDRLELMDILTGDMDGLATLDSVSIVGNDVVLELTAGSLKDVSELRLRLLDSEYVTDATVYNAKTNENSGEDTGTISASMTIHVAPAASETAKTLTGEASGQ